MEKSNECIRTLAGELAVEFTAYGEETKIEWYMKSFKEKKMSTDLMTA